MAGKARVFKTEPRDYQLAAVKWLVKRDKPFAALLLEPRTGKTKVAIDYISYLFHKKEVRRVLVIAPLPAFSVWREEVEKHSAVKNYVYFANKPKSHNKSTTTGRGGNRRSLPHPTDDKAISYAIINYEAFASTKKLIHKQMVIDWKPDVIILDESHKIKSPASKAGRVIRAMAGVARYRLILTGTVLTKYRAIDDIYGQWTFLDPSIRERWPTAKSWREYFAEWRNWKGYPEMVRLKNQSELKYLVSRDSFVVRRDDVLDVVPIAKCYYRFPLEESRDSYEELANEMVAWLQDNSYVSAPIKIAQLTRLSQMTSGWVPDQSGVEVTVGEEKTRALLRLLGDIGEEKVVISCRYRRDISSLAQRLRREGYQVFQLVGGLKPEEVACTISGFRSSSTNRAAMIVQSQVAALAIDLSVASHLIIYSYSYSWSDYKQGMDRIALSPVGPKVWHLIAEGTIDEHAVEHLSRDGKFFQKLISDPNRLRYLG